jgi:hypothetical protein
VLLSILIRIEEDGWSIIAGAILFLFGFIGWGVFLTSSCERYITQTRNVRVIEVLKGKHISVVITDDNPLDYHVFTGYESDKIDTCTRFFFKKTIRYNYYNYILSEDETFLIKSK